MGNRTLGCALLTASYVPWRETGHCAPEPHDSPAGARAQPTQQGAEGAAGARHQQGATALRPPGIVLLLCCLALPPVAGRRSWWRACRLFCSFYDNMLVFFYGMLRESTGASCRPNLLAAAFHVRRCLVQFSLSFAFFFVFVLSCCCRVVSVES